MKSLSLTQPWASLIATRAKTIETRSFPTRHRGQLAIHASKAFPGYGKRLCESRMFCQAMGWPVLIDPLSQEWLDDSKRRIQALPLGTVVATCKLVACVPTAILQYNGIHRLSDVLTINMTEQERAFGDYEDGRWAWVLEDVKPLAVPVPAKGALGLWEWKP